MIPTMILFGLVFGRWWLGALVAAALVWPALLLSTAVISLGWEVPAVGALGLANAAAGILVHQAVLQAVRKWG